jgi:hypothetical protein
MMLLLLMVRLGQDGGLFVEAAFDVEKNGGYNKGPEEKRQPIQSGP